MRIIDADKAKGYVDLCLCGVGGEMGEALRPVYKWVKKLIDSVPTAEPQREWIPVSERLPESAGVYIVTREFTDGFECADLTDACYFDGTSTWHNDNRINHDREYVDKKIKAWMPLPEPYKA